MIRNRHAFLFLPILLLAVTLYSNTIQAAVPKGVQASALQLEAQVKPDPVTRKQKNVLVVACDRDYPPFTNLGLNGKASGLLIDLWQLWAEKTDNRLEFLMLNHPDTLKAIKEGMADFHAGQFLTTDSSLWLHFSRPVYEVESAFFYVPDYGEITAPEELTGQKVGALIDSHQADYLGINHPEMELIEFESQEALIEAADQGLIKAFFTELLPMKDRMLHQYERGHFKMLDTPRFSRKMHAAALTDNAQLIAAVNSGLSLITHQDWRELEQRWIIDPADRIYSKKIEQIELTPAETAWLAQHPNIRLGVDPAWPPFEFLDATKVYSGIGSSYVQWLNERLNVNMAPVPNISWFQVMKMARVGGVDVLPCVVKTRERAKFLLFTKPYLSFPMVIVTRQETPFVNGVMDFENGKVGVVKGYVTQDLMERDYPHHKFYLADDIDQALKAVSRGRLDAFVGNLPSVSYGAQKLGLSNLKVATTTAYRFELAFAIRKDWPELVGILEKTLAAMPEAEKNRIHNRWINVHFEQKTNWLLIFKLVGGIVLVAGVVLLLFIRWNRALSNEIAERKQITEALRDSRAAARGLLDATRESLFLLDGRGKVIAVNTTAAMRFQKSPEEITGTNFFDLLPAEVREERRALFDQVMQTGEPEDFEGTRDDIVMQIRYYPVKDKTRGMSGVAVFGQDITERKKAEMELKKLSMAVEQSPASVVITNPLGIIEYVNPKFSELTGYGFEEVVGENPRILNSGELPREHYKDLWDTILAGNEWHGEFHNKKKDGELFWEHAHISPIRDREGKLTNFVAVKEDITERRRMREELIMAKQAADEANKAKGDFLANMSHEIRTPMNAVIGMAHLALKTNLTPKQRDYLKKIQTSANSLLGIINDILDFSKIEAGKMDMELVDFSLDEVLDNLANLITVKAQEKEDLEVLIATAADVPRFLIGDSLRLGQVLINLAGNAVKFTERGEILVSTELVEIDPNQVTLKFSVTDTGIGLTKAQMDKLFQSFSQADTSTTRKYGGTGLGLTISKRLVEMMGGEIHVQSEPGQGAAFSFTAIFGQSLRQEKRRLVPPPDLLGMKVLVVDDNATSRDILGEILASFKFDVTSTASAEEGLVALQKAQSGRPFDLVLMDWKMPEIDGFEASRRIKELPNFGRMPAIVLVTAHGREELIRKTASQGLDGFLIKPVTPSMLFDTVMHIFGKAQSGGLHAGLNKDWESEALEDIRGCHVLLVEDNEINQQVARELLSGAGLKVSIANNGLEALNAVKATEYDAVLMDVQMPLMDGYEATRKIREWEEKMAKASARAERVPIIAMTAHAMTGDYEKSLEAGMVDHVTKPIDPQQLFTKLARWTRPGKISPADRLSGTGLLHKAAAKGSVEIPEAGASELDEEKFPDSLPGFDLADGLKRLQGNCQLYKKLLLSFAANHSQVVPEVRQALDAADYTQARQILHSLKGVSANLSIKDLRRLTVELEKLLKKETEEKLPVPPEVYRKLDELESLLHQTLEAIQTLRPTEKDKAAIPAVDRFDPIYFEFAKDTARRLREAAEMGDVTGIVSIGKDIDSGRQSFVSYKDRIARLADDFDFEGILKLATELEKLSDNKSG